ncbi:MAG: hypothetical protein LBB79_08465, partial [Prevotellaceae bacterium]|nr:hypothetical protein [Prevotellaceae bacterium]
MLDLRPGDTIHTPSGRSTFILKTVNRQSDGVYKGLFLFWVKIWNVKIVCEYRELSVNTDNQIVKYDFESLYNPDPALLLDADAAKEYFSQVADEVATLTTSTSIKDTVALSTPVSDIYANAAGEVVVVGSDGSETVLAQELNRTLLKAPEGNEYVATSGGQVMGVEEFKATGGNARMMDSYNKEKEAKAQPGVTFSASPGQKYGFDAYADLKSAILPEYPELKPGYRPAFKSVASYALDKVQVGGAGNEATFRTEMGIPAQREGSTLTVRGGSDGDEFGLYAYRTQDSTETVVGKLNLLSFDEQVKKFYIVSVNGAPLPAAATLRDELNRIFAPAVTRWDVRQASPVNVSFPNGHMTHGGSNVIEVYNADQKLALKAFSDVEKDAFYLFFVENVQGRDLQGDYGGYMPLQYRSGFIYGNPNAATVAHELAHGAFNLYHTFSSEKFVAAQNSTNNLMDYKGETELWKRQWKFIHDPQSLWLEFLQDEEEGERASWKIIDEKHTKLFNYVYDNNLNSYKVDGNPYSSSEWP